jgi:hypothetical protein
MHFKEKSMSVQNRKPGIYSLENANCRLDFSKVPEPYKTVIYL